MCRRLGSDISAVDLFLIEMTYIIAIISILLGAFAQYFLKVGTSSLKGDGFSYSSLSSLLSNPYLWYGCVAYGVSLLFWLYVLSKMELSKAYPMVSLGYVFSLMLGYLWLDEALSFLKVIGLILIMCEVIWISRG